ncbi:hypothetical protein NJ76_12630, partial [Rhodococcus sp. IITR03]
MLAPERRTRTDLLVAAALVVTALVAASVVWLNSDARGTTSTTWDGPVPTPAAAQALPRTLAELWRAPSTATTAPVVSGGTIATADSGAVVGRDRSRARNAGGTTATGRCARSPRPGATWSRPTAAHADAVRSPRSYSGQWRSRR